MTVFITDSEKRYEASAAESKVLLDIAVIKASNFLTSEEIYRLNAANNSSEVAAGELYIEALEQLLSEIHPEQLRPIPFMEHKPAYEQVYSLLFHRLSEYGKHRFQLEEWIRNFPGFLPGEAPVLEFDLGSIYNWFRAANQSDLIIISIRPEPASLVNRFKSGVKNLLQSPLRMVKPVKKASAGTTKVLIISYNIPHHLEIFKNYARHTLKNTSHEIHVVIVSNESNSPENLAEQFFGKNERLFTYDFAEFRTTNFRNPTTAIDEITRQLPGLSFLRNDTYFDNTFRSYSWMETLFTQLDPSVALIVNLHETGRIMSDVATTKGVPTIQVDYGLFADHHLMNSRISFTARAVISDAVKEVWEKRGDTSLERIPIGFSKLDDARPEAELLKEKSSFFKANGLDPEKRTIFFASTWSQAGEAYDTEKQEVVRALSRICKQNGYNLIVKKHPLEFDHSLEKLVEGCEHQRIFSHPEITLEKAIVFSDVITTQGSSVVLESLLYKKLPVFLGFSEAKQLILAGMTNKDDVLYFCDFDKFEAYVHSLENNAEMKLANERRVQEKIEHILYKTDGKAYIRLYELAEKLIKTAPSND